MAETLGPGMQFRALVNIDGQLVFCEDFLCSTLLFITFGTGLLHSVHWEAEA